MALGVERRDVLRFSLVVALMGAGSDKDECHDGVSIELETPIYFNFSLEESISARNWLEVDSFDKTSSRPLSLHWLLDSMTSPERVDGEALTISVDSK
jgi:hypothetical protein